MFVKRLHSSAETIEVNIVLEAKYSRETTTCRTLAATTIGRGKLFRVKRSFVTSWLLDARQQMAHGDILGNKSRIKVILRMPLRSALLVVSNLKSPRKVPDG